MDTTEPSDRDAATQAATAAITSPRIDGRRTRSPDSPGADSGVPVGASGHLKLCGVYKVADIEAFSDVAGSIRGDAAGLARRAVAAVEDLVGAELPDIEGIPTRAARRQPPSLDGSATPPPTPSTPDRQ